MLTVLLVILVAPQTVTAGIVPTDRSASPTTSSPCGITTKKHPKIDHVIWVWMENESYNSIIGSADAPYETTLARKCGIAANYQAISHPSLPNYLAATAGSTFGISDDNEPAAHPIRSSSLYSQVSAAHETWNGYVESMPTNCDLVTSGDYAARHNPAVYYVPLRSECAHNDVPMGTIANGSFAVAARKGHLANFSFITPNICDDAHSCPVLHGDEWLAMLLPTIFSSPQYRSGSVVVFLVFDEGNFDNHVPAIVAAPTVPRGAVSHVLFSHYSLLRTTEQLLSLGFLRSAAHATSMITAFNL